MGKWGEAADLAQGPSDYMQFKQGMNCIRVLTDPWVQNVTYKSDPTNPKTVFTWIVFDYGTNVPKVLTKGVSFLKKLDFIGESWGEQVPMKCDINIKVTGQGLDTEYEFSAIPISTELPVDIDALIGSLNMDKLAPNRIPISEFMQGAKPKDNASSTSFQTGVSGTPNPNNQPDDVVVTDIGDEPINLDDIPF